MAIRVNLLFGVWGNLYLPALLYVRSQSMTESPWRCVLC